MSDAPKSSEPTTVDLHLADVLDGYCREVGGGQDPDPEAYLAAHPELAGDLGECLQGLAAIEELRAAVQVGPAAMDPFQPRRVGNFELLREIGRGGMGVVYEARHVQLGRRVALKMIRAGDLASREELERFRAEALAVASLQHPNIVQIYEVGELEGRPYLALEFVDGGSMEKKLARTPLPGQAAGELLEVLARAVHFAHEQKIVHRDLKPANVLLQTANLSNDNWQLAIPKITDFGLAKRLDSVLGQTHTGMVMGTPPYMAPEQAAGKTRDISPATDIYALGAILYEMLTGRTPFQGETPWDTLMQVMNVEPVPPSRLQPRVARDLETICLKCLQKDPRNRYASALALAEDLRRFLAGEPIQARPVGALERLWRWGRRHPALAGFTGTAVVLLISATVIAIWVARDRAARLEQEVLRSNVYAAQGVASTVLWHFDRLSGPVVQAADNAELRRHLQQHDAQHLQQFLEEIHRKYAGPAGGFVPPGGESAFQSWHLLDAEGKLVADSSLLYSPRNRSVVGKSFRGRDYFQGALRHQGKRGRDSAYISRVYKSKNDDLYKFAITVPICAGPEADAPLLGVLAATITTTSTLGPLRLNDERRTAVLVGRRDTNPPAGPPRVDQDLEYLILLHPAYRRGEDAIPVAGGRLRAIHHPGPGSVFQLPASGSGFDPERAMDADYEDPLATHDAHYQGRWLAGFAPVGNTEFVVIVQQRYDDVIDQDILWGGLALSLGILLITAALWYAVQRVLYRRARRAAPAVPGSLDAGGRSSS